jgi:putative PEP-CTERM system histidine kinase
MTAILYTGCALIYVVLAVVVLTRARHGWPGYTLAVGCVVTALWASAIAAGPALPNVGRILEPFHLVAWYGVVFHLYHRSMPRSRIKRLFAAVGLLALLVVAIALTDSDESSRSISSFNFDARLGLAICSVLLIENLYRNTPDDLRWHVALLCCGLGGLFVYDIVLYADALLFRRVSSALFDGRAVVTALAAPLLAVSAGRNRKRRRIGIQVSRTVVFYSASLMVCGVFLVALAITGEVLRQLNLDSAARWGVVAEVGLICGGLLASAVMLTSGSARSRLRNLVVNHFFPDRYDYRLEWTRCIGTLSTSDTNVALHTRAIRAVAQAVDSPAGILFLREAGEGVFRWAGSWNLPAAILPIQPDHTLLPLFRDGTWIVEAPAGAPWIANLPDLWLSVPLCHSGSLNGLVFVAKPRAPFKLDREVFDLLRMVGREIASFVAERHAAEALLQTRQLREYGQRFAFVAHDIKNVSSQLSLLLSNAEHHISDPAFQRDMLRTVGASVEKISSLLSRLKDPEHEATPTAFAPRRRLTAIIDARFQAQQGCIRLLSDEPPGGGRLIAMVPTAFDAVVTHLLNNAFEASRPGAPVEVRVAERDQHLTIDIVDEGIGMDDDFIRDQLFRPFRTSKHQGSGLGVYQARELLRRAGGDLLVTSRPNGGTTMQMRLPFQASHIVEHVALGKIR